LLCSWIASLPGSAFCC